MGASYRVYAGPYLFCRVRTSPVIEKIKVCPVSSCRFHRVAAPMEMHHTYCPQCGQLGEVREIELDREISVISQGQLVDATGERIAAFNTEYPDPGVHLFVPNVDWLRNFIYDRNSAKTGELHRVRAATLEQEMSWLESHFGAELLMARGIYGEDQVEVRWGVLAEFL